MEDEIECRTSKRYKCVAARSGVGHLVCRIPAASGVPGVTTVVFIAELELSVPIDSFLPQKKSR